MLSLNYWKKLFNSLPKFGGVALDHEIEEVFECNGKKYYKFVNEFNIPCQRAIAYLDVQAELSQSIDKKYLENYFEAVIENANKGNLSDVGYLTRLAQQRMQNVAILDTWYKVASVLYFDENENPYNYDYEYNEKKIIEWKRHGGALGFFSATHLKGLTTFLNFSDEDMQSYSRGQQIQLMQILKYRLANLSENEKNKEKLQKLKSDVNTLEELISLTT